MSSVINKYLDVDSTYRDRKLYPLASNFVMPVTFTQKATNIFFAQDPVALAYPYEINLTSSAAGIPVTSVVLNSPFKQIDNLYSNSLLEVDSLALVPSYSLITNYLGSTRTATLETAVTINPGNLVSIRKQLPVLRDTLAAGSTTSTVVLGAAASNQNGIYNGYIIRFVTIGGVASTAYSYIKSYDGSTKTATISTLLPSAPVLGDIYEIIQYNYDNYNPLLYSGTTVMTQPVCYSIELLYLTIPNTTILNGNRGELDDYPYFYVKLYNENKNSSNHILYSNNPHSEFATFKVPMTIVLRSESYFTLRDSKCVQVIKFQPDQAIRFTVTLPNGDPIIFSNPDYYSPNEPNPYLQISASFAIREI